MTLKINNAIYTGADNRQHTYDLVIPENFNGIFLLFMHGFMGFKDWGCWGLMMDNFVSKGYGFCRFNVSHNGTTPQHPIDFTDLEAFGKNSYFKELEDLQQMIEICTTVLNPDDKLILVGHSRGGGMVMIGGQDQRVNAIVSLAGICSIEKRFPGGETLAEWERSGVRFIHNSRTGQELPQFFTQYEEFSSNKSILNIERACLNLKKPVLLIHGDEDKSVDIEEGRQLSLWLKSELQVVQGADHTFGSRHPWDKDELPYELSEVCRLINDFASTVR